MTEIIQVYIPPGRFVSGDLTSKRTTNARGQAIPEDKQQFEFGVAVRKDAPGINEFWGQLINGAKQCFVHNPQVAPVIDAWLTNGFQGFSMKVSDGDKPSQRTQTVNPNTAECWVVWFSSSFPIRTADNMNVQIDPAQIKRGYYVDCTATLGANNNAIGDGIGIFMNPGLVRFLGVGEEIHSGPSIEQLAAAMPSAPALPPGATAPGMAPPAPGPMPGQPMQQPAPVPGVGQPMQQPPAGQPVAGGQMPPGVPPVGGTAHMPPGVPAGTPQAGPVGQPGGTVSPTSPAPGYPPYGGAMNPPS